MKTSLAILLALNLGVALAISDSSFYAQSSSFATTDVFCWKDSYGRGAGTIPKSCPSDKPDKDGGLCYKDCSKGYKGVGPVCWKGLKAKGRGAGTIPSKCADGYENDAGLCYKDCRATYDGVGPVCWKKCAGFTPIGCGAGCASTGQACMKKIVDQTSSVISMMADITELFVGGASFSSLLEASASQVGTQLAYQAAYDTARLFKADGYSQYSYVAYMQSGASKIGTTISTATLISLYQKASTTDVVTLTASMVSTFDPTGIADVVVAFANTSC